MRYNFVKRTIAAAAATILAVGVLTGCGSSKIDGTKTVATYNDTEIPLGLASLMMRYQQATMYTQYGAYLGSWSAVMDQDSGATFGESTKKSIMDAIEDRYLLQDHMDDYSVALTDDEKTSITAAAEQFMSDNDKEVIEKIGCSQSDVEQYLSMQAIYTKMYDSMTADVDTDVSDDEAAQKTITYVSVSTLGTSSDADGKTVDLTDEQKSAQKDKAQSVLDQIKGNADPANADISTIAQSVDSALSASTTSYGSDDENLDDELKKAADTLQDGQVYDSVVEGENAYFVVRMDSTFDQSATDTKKQDIVAQRKQDAFDEKVDEWKKDVTFTVDDKVWNKVSLKDDDIYQTLVPSETPSPAQTDAGTEITTDTGTEITTDTGTEITTDTGAEAETETTTGAE